MVDGDRVDTLAELEVDCSRVLVDGHPRRAASQLDPGSSKDERAVRIVLELVLGVDPPADRDVARRTGGELPGLGHADRRRGRQQPPDPVARPEAAQHEHPGPERGDAQDDQEEGTHGGDDTRRAWKGP